MTVLPDSHRLLLEAKLRPVQGERFQPAGFPDLGPAEMVTPSGRTHLLVESAQSMANHLEMAIWDPLKGDLVEPLRGMPYVRQGSVNSVTEAHRVASPYLLPLVVEEIKRELNWGGKRRPEMHEVARVLLRYDPGSLLHGVFFSMMKPGNVKLPRLLSAFIEARDVTMVPSGGVKFDHNDPSGPSKDGKGHVPFARSEYLSDEIVAFFNLDLVQLRSYGLSDLAAGFLFDLALYKIRRVLDRGLRLRTACDFEVVELRVTRPAEGFELPSEAELSHRLGMSVSALSASGEFPDPAVWEF